MLWLNRKFARKWQNLDAFSEVKQIKGKIFREMPGRRTLQFIEQGKSYFLKLHLGIGWREIIKNLCYLRWPVLGASNEYQAILHCQKIGVQTMVPVAFGKRGSNPAKQLSFIITEELVVTQSLEDFCRDWATSPPDYYLKRCLIEKVADISRVLHQSGLNHRDYYLCHFLLKLPKKGDALEPDKLELFLIDLHRAQLRPKPSKRWLIKDIAGLCYSCDELNLSERDLYRFIRRYTNKPLPEAIASYRWLWQSLDSKLKALRDRKRRYGGKL